MEKLCELESQIKTKDTERKGFMKRMKKLISLVAVAAMMAGVLLPVAKVAKAAESTDVVIHKLELSDLTGWPKGADADGTVTGKDNTTKYNGGEIANKDGFFGAGTKELDGVYFTYWKISEAQYKKMSQNPGDYDTVKKVEDYFGTDQTAKDSKTKIGPTAGGAGVKVEGLEDGYYWFVEHMDSLLADGKTLSKAAAVPFGLQLPVYKQDGSRFSTGGNALHVYPKNTVADKPKVDKNFDEPGSINLDDAQRIKAKKDATVGQEIPYVVMTEIPAKANYKTAKWNDEMTEGLTFDQTSLKVEIGTAQAGPFVALEAGDFTKTVAGNGFTVELTDTGLGKINEKANPAYVRLTYKATVNSTAVVDIPESNDVTFIYGNNPSHGNTPKPNKPNENGEIKVSKTWVEADGTNAQPPAGVNVTVMLKNAQTGEMVGQAVQLNAGNGFAHTFNGLDKNIQYIVEEVDIAGYSAEYMIEAGGITKIKNWKENNPTPLKPSEPKVVTGGHRFQKIDAQTKAGLAGATFVIKNQDGKFLAKKTEQEKAANQGDYVAKEKAYLDLVKKPGTTEEIKAAKEARDRAYEIANAEWKFVTAEGDAATFTSGVDGYFKVTGLAYGTYTLVEKEAPEGYAKRADLNFVVAANSAENATRLEPTEPNKPATVDDPSATLVENKKISIPQTGGRGTILFVLVGLAIMGSAVVAMKRRNVA